jgi:signal transduction histidine kinase
VHIPADWTLFPVLVSKTTSDSPAAGHPDAQRFELMRRIADDLAHELKNPLNAMVINLEVLRGRVRSGAVDGALERIAVIEAETRRLHTLLDHMLRFLRPDHLAPTEFAVAELVAEVGTVVQVLAKLRRRELAVEMPGDGLYVRATREPLRFALLALCEAALAALPDGAAPARLTATGEAGGVALQLTVPGAAAGALATAEAFARSVLAGEPVRVDVGSEAGSYRATLLLPRPEADPVL